MAKIDFNPHEKSGLFQNGIGTTHCPSKENVYGHIHEYFIYIKVLNIKIKYYIKPKTHA